MKIKANSVVDDNTRLTQTLTQNNQTIDEYEWNEALNDLFIV